jgi:uncharacterized membrane protein
VTEAIWFLDVGWVRIMDQKETNESEWRNPDNWSGPLYFSKKDSRTWVPKSIPWMGWTLNIGRTAGAYWLLGFLIGLPIFIILMQSVAAGR